MRIDGLPEQPKIPQANQRNAAGKARDGGARPADPVQISRDAPEISGLSELAKSAPEELASRVSEIRARMESGFYDTRAARQKIADALLSSSGLRVEVEDIGQFKAAMDKLKKVPETREEAVASARSKVPSGAFDTREALENTAQRMIEELA